MLPRLSRVLVRNSSTRDCFFTPAVISTTDIFAVDIFTVVIFAVVAHTGVAIRTNAMSGQAMMSIFRKWPNNYQFGFCVISGVSINCW